MSDSKNFVFTDDKYQVPRIITPRKTLIDNHNIAVNGATWTIRTNLAFVPQALVIKQTIYANIAGTDSGIYLLKADFAPESEYVTSLYVGIQSNIQMPMSVFNVNKPLENITFSLVPANTTYVNPTGQIAITLEFY